MQAGGNFGLWPNALAKRFKTVYSFEPDSRNFPCLAWNTRHNTNVFRFQAALGDKVSWVGLKDYDKEHNAGAIQINGHGFIPVMRLDDFKFEACDLLCLDIEGQEPEAIMGARRTISMFKPTILIEDKGIASKSQRDAMMNLFSIAGYKQVLQVNNDKVFTC